MLIFCFFFFKQKTAYEMVGSDWSSDVCSSDLRSTASSSTTRTVPRAAIMAVHNGCNEPGRQVIEVALGADRAWWSDWSSKPAGVLLDLGRFDSYTLPPRFVLFVSHLRDMAV